MMDRMCNFVDVGTGKLLCAIATTVGGLHLTLTESQGVLGTTFNPQMGWLSVQHGLGLFLTLCGVCCVMNCME